MNSSGYFVAYFFLIGIQFSPKTDGNGGYFDFQPSLCGNSIRRSMLHTNTLLCLFSSNDSVKEMMNTTSYTPSHIRRWVAVGLKHHGLEVRMVEKSLTDCYLAFLNFSRRMESSIYFFWTRINQVLED